LIKGVCGGSRNVVMRGLRREQKGVDQVGVEGAGVVEREVCIRRY
jgi:hypothetical protein